MITILIITALFVYLLCKVMPLNDPGDYLVLCLLGPVLGGFIGLIVSLSLPMDFVPYVKHYKHKNNEFNQIIIDDELYYTFLVENNGQYEVKYISGDYIKYEVVREPKYIKEYGKTETDSFINYFAMDSDISIKTYIVEVDSTYINKKVVL